MGGWVGERFDLRLLDLTIAVGYENRGYFAQIPRVCFSYTYCISRLELRTTHHLFESNPFLIHVSVWQSCILCTVRKQLFFPDFGSPLRTGGLP